MIHYRSFITPFFHSTDYNNNNSRFRISLQLKTAHMTECHIIVTNVKSAGCQILIVIKVQFKNPMNEYLYHCT